jgi:hypothetical protein
MASLKGCATVWGLPTAKAGIALPLWLKEVEM